MVWFKVDDSFWSHPKVLPLSAEAVALWVRAGAYCAQQLTDGHVSMQALRMLADRDAAVELTNAGLWDLADGGFQFHDWAEYQPTRDHVLTERAKATERKRKSRTASRTQSRPESRRDTRGTDAVIGVRTSPPKPPALDPATLSPFCAKHTPAGPGGRSCRACGDAKFALLAAQAAAKSKPTPTPTRDPECEIHPGYPLPCDRCARDAEEAG
jgi:hypothetical protein